MNPIKLWFSYEKNSKKLDKAFKENMVQDKKTGVWRNKKMAKKELKEQLKSYEGYINDIPLVIDLKKLNGIYSAMKDRCYYRKDKYYKDVQHICGCVSVCNLEFLQVVLLQGPSAKLNQR